MSTHSWGAGRSWRDFASVLRRLISPYLRDAWEDAFPLAGPDPAGVRWAASADSGIWPRAAGEPAANSRTIRRADH